MLSAFSCPVVTLGSGSYLINLNPIVSLPQSPVFSAPNGQPLPVTVIDLSEHTCPFTASNLQRDYFGPYLTTDDVLSEEFLSKIIFRVDPGLSHPEIESLPSGVTDHIFYESEIDIRGPYFLIENQLHKVFKLFPDPYGAFVSGVTENEKDPSSHKDSLTDDIPIPSRLYYPKPCTSKPLLGKRLAIKDIYDIRGLKTGAGSKAYLQFQQPASKTAPAIQKLIDQGAVIVGKVKNTQHVSGMAPRDWIDYQCPFNPRGDGYLDTDCSSSGSGAAVAGYEWLDGSIGSDSLGSMVGPAVAGGIYGIRPTQGVLSNEGAVAVSSILDTPGHFCRDVETFSRIATNWIGNTAPLNTEISKPTQLLVLEERFTAFKDSERKIMESFIQDFERALQMTRRNLNIEAEWKNNAPEDVRMTKLGDHLSTTLATVQLFDSYHNNLPFRKDYKTKFGIHPAVDELVRYKWELGSRIPKESYDTARTQAEVFKKFLQGEVLKEGTVMFIPGGMPFVNYRDSYPGDLEASGKPWQGFGFTNTAFSSLGGVPCVSFPVGHASYQSKHSGREELKPVSLWILGAPATDAWLIDLVAYVTKLSGRPMSVKTGKTAF